MAGWQYLEALVGDRAWVDSTGRWAELTMVDVGHGRARAYEWETSALLMDELGRQGWELTGVTSDASGGHRLFFKKPLE
jgi:hypothetical protein